MKRYTAALALLLLVSGVAACGDDRAENEISERNTVPDPAIPPEVDPGVYEGATMMDTSMVGQNQPAADTSGT